MPIVTPRTLDALPAVAVVRRCWQAGAMFDAIAEADANWRVFKFAAARTIRRYDCGIINTRQGVCVCAALLGDAAFIRGYSKSSPLSPGDQNRLVDRAIFGRHAEAPRQFQSFRTRWHRYCGRGATFAIWRLGDAAEWDAVSLLWETARLANCHLEFMEMLVGDPAPFGQWVRDCYEREDLQWVVDALYQFTPLTPGLVRAIDPRADMTAIGELTRVIGYPIAE
jgi:hypothetical protein